jgi:RNA polymerase sigma factor (sigma-70 family)
MVDQYYHRVLCFARQLTDPATAEDVTQDVFTKLLDMEDLAEKSINISYLLKIAHNLIRGSHRKKVRHAAAEPDLVRNHTARVASAAAPEPNYADAEALLARCDAVLTDNEQRALRLTVVKGLSLKEAAESLGVKVSTVTNWKYRGLRKLSGNLPAEHAIVAEPTNRIAAIV